MKQTDQCWCHSTCLMYEEKTGNEGWMSVSDVTVLGAVGSIQSKNGSRNWGMIAWCVGHFTNTNDALSRADARIHDQVMIQMGVTNTKQIIR